MHDLYGEELYTVNRIKDLIREAAYERQMANIERIMVTRPKKSFGKEDLTMRIMFEPDTNNHRLTTLEVR